LSLKYPDLENNFPDSIDNFDKFLDPTISVLGAIDQYYTLFDAGDLAGATAVLEANPTLKQMIINADNLNKLRDGIVSLQRYYMNDIQQYLVELVKHKGVYNSSATYTKYDVVEYTIGTKTESYMGISTTIPIGTLPTDTNYFIKITLQGEQGISGTGLSYRQGWSSATQYYLDDCVAYNNMLWSAKRDNLNVEPLLISDDWLMIMEIPRQIVMSETEPIGQMIGDYWYQII